MLRQIYNKINNMVLYVEKFIYYGRIGASKCVDYDSNSIHTLIYAHMKRVHKFMNSDKTHLIWNDKPNTNLMRKLAEFVELSKMKSRGKISDSHNFTKTRNDILKELNLLEKNETDFIFNIEYPNEEMKKICKKKLSMALKKDIMITNEKNNRYHYILKHYVPHFWD